MTIPEAIARLYALRVDTTTRDGDGAPHEKPHKPLLLLAVSEPLEWGANCDRKQTKPTTDEPETEKLRCAAPPFIDAAHLLPWDRYRNDHPTNGLALCKNHHWAMDRNVIAPAPDHRWRVSKVIDPRRSNGEKELSELAGQALLLPKDPAFYPNEAGLEWRTERLSESA
ncbi:MAG: HNH endonuclease [Verrucomicrobiota bacterium]